MSVRLDAEFWSARMAYLAQLAHADAIAVVLQIPEEGFVSYASHNLPSDPGWNGAPAASLLERAFADRQGAQAAAVLPLADGRASAALLVRPIVWSDQLVGALGALRASGAFDEREAAEAGRIADLVGLELAEATALRRAQAQQTDLESRMRAHVTITELTRREHDPDQLLERATAQLADLFAADGVSIMLADDAGQLSVRSSVGLSEAAKRDRKKVGEGISGHVAQTGHPLLLSGAVRDQRFTGNDPSIGDAIVAPLRIEQRTIGVVNVKRRATKERYGQAHVESLTAVAGELADAFVAAEAMRRVEDDRRQALVLYELSRLATLGNDPQTDLETAVAMLGDTLGHDVVGLWTLDPGGGLRLRAGRGYGGILPDYVGMDALGPEMAATLAGHQVTRARYPEESARPEWASIRAAEFLVAPVGSHGNVFGALVLGRRTGGYAQADADLALTLGEYLSGSIEKRRAGDAPEVVTANERKRIAQEIHDGIAQELTGVVLTLEGAQRALERDPGAIAPQIAKAARDARATLADVRQYMAALRANEGAALNLPVTVARLVDDLRRQTGLRVEMEELGVERELAPIVERAVMRIVAESLRNVAQHARATNAKLGLTYGEHDIVVTVEDDGVGFDAERALTTGGSGGHFGLLGMKERAEGGGGELVVLSQPGRGTILKASVPYEPAAPAPRMPEPTPAIEDVDQPAERTGIIAKLLRR